MAKFGIGAQFPLQETCLDSTPRSDGEPKHIRLSYFSPESKDPPQLGTVNERLVRIKDLTFHEKKRETTFTLEAVKGAAGTAYLWDKAGNQKEVLLRVVIGPVKNHGEFKTDLLAELLGRSEDPVKLRTYQAILNRDNNNTAGGYKSDEVIKWDVSLKAQPLKQITADARQKEWNCGGALAHFGTTQFGGAHFASFGNTRYYKPFRGHRKNEDNKQSEIEFDKDKLRKGVEAIRSLLAQGKSVILFAVHHDGFTVTNGVIQQRNSTHFVSVIGCDVAGTTFLIADPWPGGSRLIYKSGIFGDVDSAFLGLLKFDERGGILSTPAGARGSHNYIVLTGP